VYVSVPAPNQVQDHVIVPTDEVFDRVPGLRRVDPLEVVRGIVWAVHGFMEEEPG
jgi:hypothetical protein